MFDWGGTPVYNVYVLESVWHFFEDGMPFDREKSR